MKFLLLSLLTVVLLACNGDPYNQFTCKANKESPAISHVQSLTSQQLELIYSEIINLKKLNDGKNITYTNIEHSNRFKLIPDSLKILNAQRIEPENNLVVLVDCMSQGVFIEVNDDKEKPELVLVWSEPNDDSRYNFESLILLEMEKNE